MDRELELVAAALYLARHDAQWQGRPYWLLRRCVVPYVAARQFLLLKRDGLPIAFAGWAREAAGKAPPWNGDRYLPSAGEISGDGPACVTEIISPVLPRERVLEEVGRELGTAPAWIERDAERRVVAVHGA